MPNFDRLIVNQIIAFVKGLSYNWSEMDTKPRTYTLRKRAQRAEETRLRIITAARSLMDDAGYPNVSLDEIAAKAEVSRQTIYVQFGSKLGVLEAMIDYVDQVGLKDLFAILRTATDPVEAIHKIVPINMAYDHENMKLFRTFRAQAVSDPDFRAVLDSRMQRRWGSINGMMEWLHREGKLAEGWSVGEATDWYFSVVGFYVYDDLVNNRGWSLEHLIHRLLDMIDTMLLANPEQDTSAPPTS